MLADVPDLHAKQLACPADKHFFRKIYVALSHRLLKRIKESALDTVVGIRMYPYARGYLISV